MNAAIAISRSTRDLLIYIQEATKRGIKVSDEDYAAAAYAVAAAKDADDEPIKRDELKVVV